MQNEGMVTEGGAMPVLSNGVVSEAESRGFVVHGVVVPGNLWLDLGIALAVALIAPFVLKWLLETELIKGMVRARQAAIKRESATATKEEEEEFDFDA